MPCLTCFEANIKSCSESIVLDAGLTATTSYYWLLTNKFGKLYQRQTDTDADGKLTIDLSVLPIGSTNPHSGVWNLSLRKGSDYLEEKELTLGGETYTCVQVKFIDIEAYPDNDYNVIQ